MQLDVFFLSSLGRNVALDFLFASVATNRANVVTIGPEFSTPKVLFDLGHSGEYFSSGNALDGPYDLRGTVGRYRLDEEVHVIFVSSYFEEYHVIPVRYLHADHFEDFIHFRGKDRSSVLRRADEMVEQDRYIMASVDVSTHASEYITRTARQAAGNLPLWIEDWAAFWLYHYRFNWKILGVAFLASCLFAAGGFYFASYLPEWFQILAVLAVFVAAGARFLLFGKIPRAYPVYVVNQRRVISRGTSRRRRQWT